MSKALLQCNDTEKLESLIIKILKYSNGITLRHLGQSVHSKKLLCRLGNGLVLVLFLHLLLASRGKVNVDIQGEEKQI